MHFFREEIVQLGFPFLMENHDICQENTDDALAT